MIDFSKLKWESDWMYSEIFDEDMGDDDYVIVRYTIKDFPEVVVYIDIGEQKIIDSYVYDGLND